MVESAHAFSEACGLETGHAARLAIIIEELVYNLVDHGGIGEDGLIELVLTHDEGVVGIALSDSGTTFDLRDAETDEAIPDRGGGAGIDLVRAWADIVEYGSDAGRNRLLLKMWLS
jgi:serine/threonine-protein kinase RsbW